MAPGSLIFNPAGPLTRTFHPARCQRNCELDRRCIAYVNSRQLLLRVREAGVGSRRSVATWREVAVDKLNRRLMKRLEESSQRDPSRKGAVACAVREAASDRQLSKVFESIEVIGLDGRRAQVTSLWKDRKVVVAWARHFGCVLCRKYAALLAEKKADFDAAGVPLIIIGPGTEKQATTFKEETSFPGEVYADPTQESFKALGFASGIGSVINPEAGLNVINAFREGFKQNWAISFEKDTVLKGSWQQGGTLIVGPGSENVHYLHKDQRAGDHPSVENLLQALRDSN